ncbi:hypothetical protein PybrP1_008371 [[Pythium] brassicae (nom. inval.)]|nr:hypothetical protein PybrP1_008371 [[Pythium] brassicae (nom. inval.)]
MQFFVHPQFKHLDFTMGKTIKFCNDQLGVAPDVCSRIADMIQSKVHSMVKRLMLEVARSMAIPMTASTETADTDDLSAIPDDLLSFFGCSANPAVPAAPVDATKGRSWLENTLADFYLSTADVYGALSDAACNCLAHLTNAATKGAFGIEPRQSSRNPEMTQETNNVRATVRAVKEVETPGTPFEALCQLERKGNKIKLLDYQAHRFLGLAGVIEPVIKKCNPLET